MNSRDRERFTAYRDAVGMLRAVRRGDEDAMEWFVVYQPFMAHSTFNGLLGIALKLMSEIERLGGDPDEVVDRLAWTVAMNEADKMRPETDS